MKQPRKHAALIKAWADGAEIEYKSDNGAWRMTWNPVWDEHAEYRIKPEPKPDVVHDVFITEETCSWQPLSGTNLRLTFSGETGELIKAEVLK